MPTITSDFIALGLALVAAGALVGLLAGLFGVGGGAIIVPILYQVFVAMSVADAVRMPLTVGTSLAIIIPTSITSYLAHRNTGAVDQVVLRLWAGPCFIGVALGSALAAFAPPWVFKIVFVIVAGANGLKLVFARDTRTKRRDLPRPLAMRAMGVAIGIVSALMGISGGMITNMAMISYGRSIHQAVATSAGLGLFISIPGAIGYALSGLSQASDLPPFSIGYVSLPAFLLLSSLSMLVAPIGARLAHSISRPNLSFAFGLYLILMATRFVLDLARLV